METGREGCWVAVCSCFSYTVPIGKRRTNKREERVKQKTTEHMSLVSIFYKYRLDKSGIRMELLVGLEHIHGSQFGS